MGDEEAIDTAAEIIGVLCETQPTSIVGRLTQSFWSRVSSTASPGAQRRFIEGLELFFSAVVQQAKHRQYNDIPDLESYIAMRRDTSGCKTCFALIEYANDLDIPDCVFENAVVRGMEEAANDIITWSNDIYSYNVEQANGDTHNMVAVIRARESLSLQQAIDYVGTLCVQCIDRFQTLQQLLPSWGPEVDVPLRAYIDGLGDWMIGSLVWSFETERYFGHAAPKVRATLAVPILPARKEVGPTEATALVPVLSTTEQLEDNEIAELFARDEDEYVHIDPPPPPNPLSRSSSLTSLVSVPLSAPTSPSHRRAKDAHISTATVNFTHTYPPVASRRSASPSSTSSTSSSSSPITSIIISPLAQMSTKEAAVTINAKAAPTLGEGKITPTVLNAWELGCLQYFRDRDIDDDKQVIKVTNGIANEVVRDWYLNDYDRYDAMSWTDFLEALRARFLPKGWASAIRSQIIAAKQTPDQSFDDFVLEVEHDGLRAIIAANIVEDLHHLIEDAAIADIVDYVDWKAAVASADGTRLRMRDMINREIRGAKNQQNRPGTKQSSSSVTVKSSSSTSSTSRLPHLTDDEKKLLNTNQGCYKCRRFFQNHTSGTCPNGYPDASSYSTLTMKDVTAAKGGKENINKVAAVTTDTADTFVVATVASSPAAMTTGILGTGSDSDESVSPLFSSHTILRASILSPSASPTSLLPMLIDSGSPTVLIRRDIAEQTGLRLRTLPSPYQLGNAWGSEQNEAKEWVKLRIVLSDNSWESRVCRAIIVPNLCSPVILGKPFLEFNSLVEDHATRRLIHSPSNRDLLSPSVIVPPPPPPSSLRSRQEQDIHSADIRRIAHLRFLRELENRTQCRRREADYHSVDGSSTIIAAVRDRVEILALQDRLDAENTAMKARFADLFPDDIPHINDLPTDVFHRFVLKDADMVIARRQYDCPKKYREVWKKLLQQHIDAGRLRPSDSPYASPCFLIPKSDPSADPRWVNDYRHLNANTVPDMHPLPKIADILADCAKGKIWAKIDMTNSFFQTRVHPDDVKFTAVTTPFGLYEWTVMPQGCRNALSTHQRRMFSALRPYIGSICHVYLDDIVIWSQTIEEHRRNVETISSATTSPRVVSRRTPRKVEKILDWPVPRSAADVRAFLGLVRYVANFLPKLTDYTLVLTPLTGKDADLAFPAWSPEHQKAFASIKQLVCSRECLTVIDLEAFPTYRIFVSCDASDLRTGAMLSFGPSLEEARPVAFESTQLRGAELNYPVHEKELLAIVRALRKWRVDLLGVPFTVFTDHRTLENFHKQKELSRRQARWQEFLAQYDFRIHYLPGEDNVATDALSRVRLDDSLGPPGTLLADSSEVRALAFACAALTSPAHTEPTTTPSGTLRVATDPAWLQSIRDGYTNDSYCRRLLENTGSLGIKHTDGLLYVGDRLVIPRVASLRESLFCCAHDALGHFGFDKSYAALRSAYYWPGMRRELEELYIPSCPECQRNKSSTTKPSGPLHPLSVPDGRGNTIAIDFVGRLPKDSGFDCIATITDRLGTDLRLIPTRTDISAEDFAQLFFDHWFCENGLPTEIVSDRDKLFVSRFWTALHQLTGVKLKLSTAYHPETDGASERTNKSLIQALRYHVARNQTGWVRALPPSLDADVLLRQFETDIFEARDNLLLAKLAQASAANAHRSPDHRYAVGDKVMLSTFHRRRDYMQRGDLRVAKFMVRWDGPYSVLHAHPDASVYTLDLPNTMKIFPTFHSSLLKPYIPNDDSLFPSRALARPGPVVTADGIKEWEVDSIVDHRRRGRGFQFLVRWKGYGPDADEWLPKREVAELEALDRYLEHHPLPV
ncbi:hypothetical protein ONZ51_g6252 [Trametes cubensis]|uniref:RNA-directed DNA polymerase n=1 Tax=Trametes cubensis TaxID=1111947 RepID=A0AAD7XBB0_9APHY|nr:hypothetical protein ONZ51_g6252 [Trametes cubensis]